VERVAEVLALEICRQVEAAENNRAEKRCGTASPVAEDCKPNKFACFEPTNIALRKILKNNNKLA